MSTSSEHSKAVPARSDPRESTEAPPLTDTGHLRADHEALEALAQSVMKTMVEGDRVGAAVAELQSRVVAHLDAEERTLFEDYARHAPADASDLLADHGKIRTALADLDVAVDLHIVRADVVEVLLATLRAHALREDAGLYRWSSKVGST